MIATNAGRFVDVRLSTERPMWPKLNPQPESELAAARLALHWAAQIPAAASSLVPAADDYTHTSLTWTNGSLVTSSLGDSRRRVALDLLGFAVELIDDEGPTQRLPLSGHTISSAVSWLSAHLGTELSLLPHELPEHPVGSGERFADPDPATLEALY
ncbi:MAG TPA: hypothetical protein ENK57_12570, partial [Polyangiaceae bacterium]|nr:hypothetical protein [Polyangiaceae bacterium]